MISEKKHDIKFENEKMNFNNLTPISYIFPEGSKSNAQLKKSIEYNSSKVSLFDISSENKVRPMTVNHN